MVGGFWHPVVWGGELRIRNNLVFNLLVLFDSKVSSSTLRMTWLKRKYFFLSSFALMQKKQKIKAKQLLRRLAGQRFTKSILQEQQQKYSYVIDKTSLTVSSLNLFVCLY